MSYWAIIGQQFAKILLGLFVLCGIFWVLDKLYFAKQRQASGIDKKSIWLEFTADLFPIIAFIFSVAQLSSLASTLSMNLLA